MDEWLNIVVRQLVLYSLPVLISLTLVCWLESRFCKKKAPHPFYAITWRGSWIPLLASIAFHRGIIIAMGQPLASGIKAALIRLLAQLLLCLIGFLLFSWSLSHQMPSGLPPLHHWWAKVFMFFNLCMAALHLLPLPRLLAGELMFISPAGKFIQRYMPDKNSWLLLALLAASPLLDMVLGFIVVFPVYEWLSNQATALF